MKFIVDAQLPKSLAELLNYRGQDAIHTSALPLRNATPDTLITELSIAEERIVGSKDQDFINGLVLHGKPKKLIVIRTGNITNKSLLKIMDDHLPLILQLIARSNLVEITPHDVIEHANQQ